MSYQSESPEETLRRILTGERLESYFADTDGSWTSALKLYEWNIRLSGATMAMTGIIEVLVRNALDAQLQRWAAARSKPDWIGIAPLDANGQRDLTKARHRAGPTGSHGKVIAELTFGFWRYLVRRTYLTSLWIPALHRAFPGLDTDARTSQRLVEDALQRLHFVRNRAAHNEPLHRRSLGDDLVAATNLARWIHPNAAVWFSSQQQVSEVLPRRP